jgi:hypothetical protein
MCVRMMMHLDNHKIKGLVTRCVSMSDKPFDTEACDIGGQASATNGLSDRKTPSKTHRVIDPLGAGYTSDLMCDLH